MLPRNGDVSALEGVELDPDSAAADIEVIVIIGTRPSPPPPVEFPEPTLPFFDPFQDGGLPGSGGGGGSNEDQEQDQEAEHCEETPLEQLLNQIVEEIAALEEANPGQEFGKVIYQRLDGSYFTSSGWGTPSEAGGKLTLTYTANPNGVIIGSIHNHPDGDSAHPSGNDQLSYEALLGDRRFIGYVSPTQYTVFISRDDGDGVAVFGYRGSDITSTQERDENRICNEP